MGPLAGQMGVKFWSSLPRGEVEDAWVPGGLSLGSAFLLGCWAAGAGP